MWREDDFEDKGRPIKVPKDEARESISDSDLEPDGKAERFDQQPVN